MAAIENLTITLFQEADLYTKFYHAQLNLSNVTYTDEECRTVCFSHMLVGLDGALIQFMVLIGLFMIGISFYSLHKNSYKYMPYILLGGDLMVVALLLMIFI